MTNRPRSSRRLRKIREHGTTAPRLTLLLGLLWLSWVPVSAQPKRPDPPRPPVVHYQPDAQGCRAEVIEAGYRRQLQPFADQSESVLAQLKLLQNELTAASIQRCRAKGLLSAEQATTLEKRLGLTSQATSEAQQPLRP